MHVTVINNKNLAIANRSRVTYAHNKSRAKLEIEIWGSLKVTGNDTIR